jgi:hypothetical protein
MSFGFQGLFLLSEFTCLSNKTRNDPENGHALEKYFLLERGTAAFQPIRGKPRPRKTA